MPSPPTAPNTHEVARAVHADARVAYVDNDPIVISHLNLLAADGNLGVAAVDGNVRDVSGILTGCPPASTSPSAIP